MKGKYKIVCLIFLISLFCVGVFTYSSKNKIHDKESSNKNPKTVKVEKLVINTHDVYKNVKIIVYNNDKVIYSVAGKIRITNKNNKIEVVVYTNILDK